MRKEGEKGKRQEPAWTVRREGMIHTGYIISTDEKDVQQIGVLRTEIEKYCQSSRGDFCGTAIKVSRSLKRMNSGKAVGLDDMTGSV